MGEGLKRAVRATKASRVKSAGETKARCLTCGATWIQWGTCQDPECLSPFDRCTVIKRQPGRPPISEDEEDT